MREAKHIIGDFEGFFEGAKAFFYPQVVLSAAKAKKVEAGQGKFNKILLELYLIKIAYIL